MAFGEFAHCILHCIAAPRGGIITIREHRRKYIYRLFFQTNIRLVLMLCLREVLAVTKSISELHNTLTELRPVTGRQQMAGVLCASACCNPVRDWPRAETRRVIGRRKRGNSWEGARRRERLGAKSLHFQ